MAFKVNENQRLVISPKSTRKQLVLGVDNADLYKPILLRKFDKNNRFQQFRFKQLGEHIYIFVEPHNRYAIVHAGSRDAHSDRTPAPIIQGEWLGNTNHIWFQLVPAGSGYYRIMAPHSGKYWGVHNDEDKVGAAIVQQDYQVKESQLFSIAPVRPDSIESTAPPINFAKASDLVRTGVLGMMGAIPTYGEKMKALVGLFWSEHDHLNDLWVQMKDYVDTRARQLINENELNKMGMYLKDVMDDLHRTLRSEDKNRGQDIRATRTELLHRFTEYTKLKTGVAPYLLNYGTILLSILRMMVIDYKWMTGDEPTKATKEEHQKIFEDYFEKLTKVANECRTEMLKNRMDQIGATLDEKSGEPQYRTYKSSVYDHADNWGRKWSYTPHESRGDTDHKQRAEIALQQRRSYIQAQYETELDAFFLQAKLWHDLNPAKEKRAMTERRTTVGAFGGAYAHIKAEGASNEKILGLIVYTNGGLLCGISAQYWNSTVLIGTKGSSESKISFTEHEYVASIYGYGRNEVSGIWFVMNTGKVVGGGATGGPEIYFSADIADTMAARLVKISGAYHGSTIEQLSFEWLYLDYPDLVPKGATNSLTTLEQGVDKVVQGRETLK